MNRKIKIAIVGYGNVGKGVEKCISQNDDMELFGIFTRRQPDSIKIKTETASVFSISDAEKYINDIDVAVLCGGSAKDLVIQAPQFAALFNTIDSYDTHAKIPEYFNLVDKAAKVSGKTSIISTGWDPGLFSVLRIIEESVLPNGKNYTFWGKGISQGHSDAIRQIEGVEDARQYTIPINAAVEQVRAGNKPELTTREKHLRECFVVAKDNADLKKITSDIKNMPYYFSDYDTNVNFISQDEMDKEHSTMPHGGFVIRSGQTGNGNKHLVEFSLKLDSNPEFTASVLLAYARAAFKLNTEGQTGAKTVFDIAPGYLINMSAEEQRKELL